ncbi:MAG: ABC transporter ATP-binding protein, partial [Tissierellia bacterium]|nr:ABC transporter ATP-binding protein [Tissierellia bacterium]
MVIEGKEIEIGYGDKIAVHKANIKINEGEVVTIIGPNGSGKSTLIKALSRCLKLRSGSVTLDGININKIPTKTVAKKMAVLPQVKSVSSDITVESLVSYGRYPHLDFRNRLTKDDNEIVEWAMEKTGLKRLKHRNVMTLSGGERQRAWIAMALAQKPQVLMLDEPTTYLDISYQLEVLELVKELNQTLGITVVMVLHDLNQAARYSDNIYVLKDGSICDYGKPNHIMKSNLLKDVFRVKAEVYEDKVNQCPYFIPSKLI